MMQWLHENVIWPLGNLRGRKQWRAYEAIADAVETVRDKLDCGEHTDLTCRIYDALHAAKVIR